MVEFKYYIKLEDYTFQLREASPLRLSVCRAAA